MKTYRPLVIALIVVLAVSALLLGGAWPGSAQSPAPQILTPGSTQLGANAASALTNGITYQGQLVFNGQPYNGTCDLSFTPFDAPSAGTQIGPPSTMLNQTITGGYFTVILNSSGAWGANAFTGNALWLMIAVRCPAGSGGYTTLAPRQPLSAAPYALGLKFGASLKPTAGGANSAYGLLANTNVTDSGNSNPVGILGMSTTSAQNPVSASLPTGVMGYSDNGQGVYGFSTNGYGVFGSSSSKYGVLGFTSSGGYSAIRGVNTAASGGIGVAGEAGGAGGTGVKGFAIDGYAVYGENNSPTYPAIAGVNKAITGGTGVFGNSDGTDGVGVFGTAPNGVDAVGVFASGSAGYALYALSSTPCCQAAAFISNNGGAVALWAKNINGTNAGIFGQGGSGVVGEANANGGIGVVGRLGSGVSSGLAGQFLGNIDVTGSVLAPGIKLHIDHPLDPANQYLNQAAMYAPEMMNVYSGNVTTDASGFAAVTLPDYVEALNTDFRYQLTVVGQFAQAIISTKLKNGQFVIQTDKPNVEVSWMVSGVRQDAYAKANPLTVEQAKTGAELGLYLFPQGYGLPASQGLVSLYSQAARVDANPSVPNKPGLP